MSDRQYNYFIKKEEECSKYKTRKFRKRTKSAKNKKNKKDKRKDKESIKINNYTASFYSSLPLFRLNMISRYDQIKINGFKLQTPISFNIGKSVAYLRD